MAICANPRPGNFNLPLWIRQAHSDRKKHSFQIIPESPAIGNDPQMADVILE